MYHSHSGMSPGARLSAPQSAPPAQAPPRLGDCSASLPRLARDPISLPPMSPPVARFFAAAASGPGGSPGNAPNEEPEPIRGIPGPRRERRSRSRERRENEQVQALRAAFGTFFRERREARGLNQNAMEPLIGLGQSAVSELERGKRELPTPEEVENYAVALDLPPAVVAAQLNYRWPQDASELASDARTETGSSQNENPLPEIKHLPIIPGWRCLPGTFSNGKPCLLMIEDTQDPSEFTSPDGAAIQVVLEAAQLLQDQQGTSPKKGKRRNKNDASGT